MVYTLSGAAGLVAQAGCAIHCPTEEQIIELYGQGSEIHYMWREAQDERIEQRRKQRLENEARWALAQTLCDLLGEPEPDTDYDYD